MFGPEAGKPGCSNHALRSSVEIKVSLGSTFNFQLSSVILQDLLWWRLEPIPFLPQHTQIAF